MTGDDHRDDRNGKKTLKLWVVVLFICMVIIAVIHPDQWYLPVAFIGVLLAFAVVGIAVAIGLSSLGDSLRRCPRCGRRGFTTLLESGKQTANGDEFFQVFHCRHCELCRLECEAEVRELDFARWEEQMQEWLERPDTEPLS